MKRRGQKPKVKIPMLAPLLSRATKHHLTISASTNSERPMASIDRLKGGEYTFTMRVPAASSRDAVTRAIEQAARLREQVRQWAAEDLEAKLRDSREAVRRANGGEQ